MPIEIRELVIRAIVEPSSADSDASRITLTDAHNGRQESSLARLDPEEAAAIVQECVRQVLRQLNRREER